jgi:ribosomal protein L40E
MVTQAARTGDGGQAAPSYGVALRTRIAHRNLAELGEWIAASMPSLDELAARGLVEMAALGRKGLSMLYNHLSTHPEALFSGDSDCTLVFLRLMHALAKAGHPVTALRCVGRGRSGLTLNCRTEGGRLCGTCANRHRARPCSHCGTVATVHARQNGQPVCLSCYENDPATVKHCARCGKPGRIAVRTQHGDRVCRRCYQPPRRECIYCGRTKLVSARTDAGSVCANCRKHPTAPV